MNPYRTAILLVCLVSPAGPVMGQAGVDELSVKQTLYVSPQDPKADNSGPGTSEAIPLQSMQKAIDKSGGINTKIVVLPGDCRELITVPPGDALLVIEAKETGKSAISGSDLLTDWKEAAGVYEHQWPHTFGPMKESHFNIDWTPLERRRELAFVDGEPYRQVLSREELVEKTFCISEADRKVYIKPAASTDTKKARVEISVRGADPYGHPPERMWLARPWPTIAATALPPMALGSSTMRAHLPAVIASAWNTAVTFGQSTSCGLATSCPRAAPAEAIHTTAISRPRHPGCPPARALPWTVFAGFRDCVCSFSLPSNRDIKKPS